MLGLQLQLGTREPRLKQKEVKRLIEVELEEEGVQIIMLEAKPPHQMPIVIDHKKNLQRPHGLKKVEIRA